MSFELDLILWILKFGFKDMEPKKFYKHCPKCANRLKPSESNLLVCQKCQFHFYINPIPTNAVIIENENGEVLLVKRKFDPKKGFWDFPGGFIHPDEEIEASTIREIKEELDVEIEIKKLIGIYPDKYLYAGINESTLNILFSAKIISGKLKADDDISGFKFFKKQDLLKQRLAFDWMKQGIKDYLKLN